MKTRRIGTHLYHARMLDPEPIFHNAMDWRIASYLIGTGYEKNARLTRPGIVSFALSVELTLKCIHTIEKFTTPCGHDLRTLFNLCSENAQDYMRRKFMAEGKIEKKSYEQRVADGYPPAQPYGLDWAIDQSKNAFEIARYWHEQGMPKPVLRTFGYVAMEFVLELRPDWIKHKPAMKDYADETDQDTFIIKEEVRIGETSPSKMILSPRLKK